MKKKCLLVILFLVLHVMAFAQTQYDYYEGKDAYGGVDTAITGIKIIGIIVLVIVIILAIAAIYGYFAGWFKHEDTPRSQGENIVANSNESKNTIQIGNNGFPKPGKPVDKVTIYGKSIEAYYTCTDGSKYKSTYWYKIESVKYHEIEIIDRMGIPHNLPLSYIEHCGMEIKEEDILFDSIKTNSKEYWLYFEGNDEFDPCQLRFRGVRKTELIDMLRIHYNGFVYSQQLYTATSNRVKYPDSFDYCFF